jgi:hypothetical protein
MSNLIKELSFTWISGWGIPPAWFEAQVRKYFPKSQHKVFIPSQEIIENIDLTKKQNKTDWLVGYSLGAFLLLCQQELIPASQQVCLLAPFFDFKKENDKGSRITKIQLLYLMRWFRNDPLMALNDFYMRTGLFELKQNFYTLPYAEQDLLFGLHYLIHNSCLFFAPNTWLGFVGEKDTLINTMYLKKFFPELSIVPSATHHPKGLINAFANTL